MKRLNFYRSKPRKTRGQSLVELAISLPLFIMLIAGIVEIGNLLVQRQRITTATDMGVRFGSRGGSDRGIYISAYNVLTQTMPVDEADLWDVFIVRGTVNGDGTGWSDFDQPVHVYGGGKTNLYADVISSTFPITLQIDILDGLQTRADLDPDTGAINGILAAGGGGAGNLGQDQAADEKIVGLMMAYNAKTILGIQNYFGQDVELVTQKYMTVHTVGEQTNGCDVYPIAISAGTRNIQAGVDSDNRGEDYYRQTSATIYDTNIGDLSQYVFPAPADGPHWVDFRVRAGVRPVLPSLDDPEGKQAIEGDIYILYEGETFEWVFYGDDIATSTTAIDMAWPGQRNQLIYDGYGGTLSNSDDLEGIHVGDLIKHSTGVNSNRATGAMESLIPHISVGRSMRFPVVEIGPNGLNTPDDYYEIAGFIILKILGYGDGLGPNHAGKPFITAEVVGLDYSCGQEAGQ